MEKWVYAWDGKVIYNLIKGTARKGWAVNNGLIPHTEHNLGSAKDKKGY